jgi:gamma-glutamylcyclotransferase (GGCT)/AIG2-like uncharacterized protein YtfP
MVDRVFHLFTYGTLRSGAGPRHPVLDSCERVGTGVVQGTLYDLGEFPALLLSGDTEVPGEIWRCPFRRLQELDAYEGVTAGLFRRAGIRVGDYACWVYVAGTRLGPRLAPEARVR